MVQQLGPKRGVSAFEGLLSGLGKGVGTGIQDMIKKKQESTQVNALTSVLAPYLSEEQRQGLQGTNMEGAKALMTAYAPIMKQMQKGGAGQSILGKWGIGGQQIGMPQQGAMQPQGMETGGMVQPQGMMQQDGQQMQPEQQQNQLSDLLQNPQFIAEVQATNPELLSSLQKAEDQRLSRFKAEEPERLRDELKQGAVGKINELDNLLESGDVGFFQRGLKFAKWVSPKYRERQAEFKTLSSQLLSDVLNLESRGALSSDKLEYMKGQLPNEWDTKATARGKLKALRKTLHLSEEDFQKYIKHQKSIEKSSKTQQNQTQLPPNATTPTEMPNKAPQGTVTFWNPYKNRYDDIPKNLVNDYMTKFPKAIRG